MSIIKIAENYEKLMCNRENGNFNSVFLSHWVGMVYLTLHNTRVW